MSWSATPPAGCSWDRTGAGKSPTVNAALRRLLAVVYPAADVTVHQASDLKDAYNPA